MSEFQFLRPLWLLILLLMPLVIWLQRYGGPGQSLWHRVIPRALLQPLLPDGHGGTPSARRARFVAPLLLALLAVALAGPSFRSAPSPLQQPDDSLVVVLDLSLSMLAADVEPDRLTRAKRKIHDLLAAREGTFTGLVVYTADGYVVTPLTDDRRTVEGMLGALDPMIMPAAGNRADLGVARAVELLNQGAPGRGRILLITDSLNPRYGKAIRQQLADTPWQLFGLMAGTETGAPVPMPERGFIRDGGRVVIAHASLTELEQTASATGGGALRMTTTDRDIARLGLRAEDHNAWQTAAGNTGENTGESARESTHERRQDDGYWLLWLAIPLALLGWRQGALAVLVIGLWWVPADPAQAADWSAGWQDLWQTPEQRAPELIAEDPAGAAARLDDPLWKGTALFRSGEYNSAVEAFAQDDSAMAHFNRGNALAHAGKPEGALEAWQAALDRDPGHEGARQNHQRLKQYLEQAQQGQQQNQSPSESDEGQQGADKRNPGDGEDEGNTGESENRSESGSEYSPSMPEGQPGDESSDAPGQQTETGSSPAPERSQPSDTGSFPGPADQAQENGGEETAEGVTGQNEDDGPQTDALSQSQQQWLRRVPDDPGGLLRRKFLQQSWSRNLQPDENDTPW